MARPPKAWPPDEAREPVDASAPVPPGAEVVPDSAEAVAALLNGVCREAVIVARSGDAARRAAFGRGLAARGAEMAARGHADVAAFLAALGTVVGGAPLADVSGTVKGPYRSALASVAADIAAGEDRAPDAWVAAIAARVASVLKHRDRAGALDLARRFDSIAATPGLEPAAADYLDVLRGVLEGRDVRARILGLSEPYRTAYLSLESVVRGADPRAEVVERVRDNTLRILERGGPAARAGLLGVLEDVAAEAERRGEHELARFARAAGALVDGRPPGDAPTFGDPELQRAWATIAAAWRAVGEGVARGRDDEA